MNIDLSTELFGQRLEVPIYNASGVHCTTWDDLLSLSSCDSVGAVLTKSSTLLPRKGNIEPRYHEMQRGTINSMGIPNHGIDSYLEYSTFCSKTLTNKPYIISVCGLSVEENLQILKKIQKRGEEQHVDAIELNLSCPNIIGKPQLAYDFDAFEDMLRHVSGYYFGGNSCRMPKLGLKLPPYFDMAHFNSAAHILRNFRNDISFITCVNSLGNGLVIDPSTESVVIKPKGGFGGVGGDYIKPTALANVRKFYELLGDKIDIVGCGGVKSGMDVFEHVLCGAKAVQIGSHIAKNGIGSFKVVLDEFREILREKGYKSLNDFRGNLKTIN